MSKLISAFKTVRTLLKEGLPDKSNINIGFSLDEASALNPEVQEVLLERRVGTFQFTIGDNKEIWRSSFQNIESFIDRPKYEELLAKGFYSVIHGPFFNSFTADSNLTKTFTQKSIAATLTLPISAYVTHLGGGHKLPEQQLFDLILGGLVKIDRLLENHSDKPRATLLLENVANKSPLGNIDLLLAVMESAQRFTSFTPDNLGLCLDTAHAMGHGYNLADRTEVDGLCAKPLLRKWLKVLHCNDSQIKFVGKIGSGKDRHEILGGGLAKDLYPFISLASLPNIASVIIEQSFFESSVLDFYKLNWAINQAQAGILDFSSFPYQIPLEDFFLITTDHLDASVGSNSFSPKASAPKPSFPGLFEV